MKLYLNFILIFFCITSCATYKTVSPTQQKKIVVYKKKIEKSEKCVSIPRIYSGTIYTGCIMSNYIKVQHSIEDVSMLPFNFIADTLILPYTIFKQFIDGNIVLKAKSKNELVDN